jgi:hypothetical protein
MNTHAAAIAADPAAHVNAHHTLKLRVIRHKYAARIAAHARAMKHHAHKLVWLHARINTHSNSAPPTRSSTQSASTRTATSPSSSRTPTPAARSRPALPISFRWPMTWPIAPAKSRLLRPATASSGSTPSERAAPLGPSPARRRVCVARAFTTVSIYTCFGINTCSSMYTSPLTRTCTAAGLVHPLPMRNDGSPFRVGRTKEVLGQARR